MEAPPRMHGSVHSSIGHIEPNSRHGYRHLRLLLPHPAGQSGVGREALHAAEVMKLAREARTRRVRGALPERQAPLRPPVPAAGAARKAATVAVSAGAAIKLLGRRNR